MPGPRTYAPVVDSLDSFVSGLGSGLKGGYEFVENIRKDRSDLAYKQAVARVMNNRELLSEAEAGYGPNSGAGTQGTTGGGGSAVTTPHSAGGVSAPQADVQEPQDFSAANPTADLGLLSGVKHYLDRHFDSGIRSIAPLGPKTGPSTQETRDATLHGYDVANAATQHGYRMGEIGEQNTQQNLRLSEQEAHDREMERMREAAANYRAGLTHGQSAAELQEKRIAMLRLAEQNARQARESLAKQITEHSLAGKFDPRMKDEVESETEAYNKALERERALGAALARELGVLATQIADPTGMPILRGGRPGPTPNPSAGGGEAATAEPRAYAAATSEPHAAGPSASQAEAAEAFKQANEKAAWLLTHTAAPANEVHRELAKEIQLIAERYGLAPSEVR